MRLYSVSFSGKSNFSEKNSLPVNYTSTILNGAGFNPGALEIEFDLLNGYMHQIMAPLHLKIINPGSKIIEKCYLYQGMDVEILAGFSDSIGGMPLAIPYAKITGVIATGTVFQVVSNYIGTDMEMDFIIYPGSVGNPDGSRPSAVDSRSPLQIDFVWETGMSFIEAVVNSLKPSGLSMSGELNDRLSDNNTGQPFSAHYHSLQAFQDFIRKKSIEIVGPPVAGQKQKYYGVSIWFDLTKKNALIADDGTAKPSPILLKGEDFIGMPTWTDYPKEIVSIHPLRRDIVMGSTVKYPDTLRVGTVSNGFDPRRKQINAAGNSFGVRQVRHVGRFRDTSPQGWCTFVWGYPLDLGY